ncbi:MAG: 16S rRNA (cytosine(1402)-N(4))-methyltransferase RsmH [Bacillota bacterium]|nr:16S rRNA (cytosine(1402)-N(4))-methyltransferase RsmH [Bacillota bacterium]
MVELHLPVMEEEVLYYLDCREDGAYVDATVGDGGHAEAICRRLSPEGCLIGIDWDEEALDRARERLSRYSDRIILVHADYIQLLDVLKETSFTRVNGILIDLGASTLQLMNSARGFSFHQEGELDMRMDRRQSLTAKKIINEYSRDELADIFFRFGEERWSRRIATAITRERQLKGDISGSRHLAEVVKEAVPARYRRHGGHPARKVFQALRLAVNSELENIKAVLPQVVESLLPGGRIVVIAYHSLEDRLIKRFFRERAERCTCPPPGPCICGKEAELKILTRKAVKPSEKEIENNPRARSARLRAAERTTAVEKKEGE